MFDLFRSREKTVKMLMGGLLGIVALSMLLYLIPGAGVPAMGDTSTDAPLAQVADETITTQDMTRYIDNQLRGQRIAPQFVTVLIPQTLDKMIAERAAITEARRLGFQVNDAELANSIRSIANIGQMTPDQYRDFLAQQGMSVSDFETNLRKQELMNNLLNLALDSMVVTPQEIEQDYRKSFEKVKLQYIAYNPDTLKGELKPTQDELKSYFDSHKGFFNVPETRNFVLLVADPVKMAATMQVTDAQIESYYNSHKENFRTPERVKARHILFMTQGKPPADVPKIKAKAEEVLKQLKAGGDFAKLAQQYSEDPGSKANGGELPGWIVRGQMVKNFENTVFTLPPKKISDLVTTEYGFHIVEVLDKQEAHLQTLPEVKDQIAAELKKGSVNDRLQSATDQAQAALTKTPNDAEQIAAKYNLTYVKVDNHKPGDVVPELGADPQLDIVLSSLKKGEVSQATQSKTKLFIAEVTQINPSHPAQFSDVEAQVREQYLRDNAGKLAQDKAKKAVELLKQNSDLNAVAKQTNGQVKETDLFTRGGAAEGLGSASQLSEAFDKKVGDYIGPTGVGAQVIVAKVIEKVEPDNKELAAKRDEILQQIKGRKAEERNNLFEDGLVSRLRQQGKIKIYKDAMDRLMARYRA